MSEQTTEAPAAAPTAQPAAAVIAAPAAQPAPPAVAWLPADADPDLIGHAQNAAWASPADAVKSHRELQKLFGADRHGRTVVMPKDDAPPEEWAAFHDKIGRPASPADYQLALPEGADPEFSKAVASKFHELGVNTKQGQALAAWWNEQATTAEKAAADAYEAQLQAEHQQLQKDWGTGPEAGMRRELAKRAATHLGLDEAAIDALEKVSGFSKTMKALAKVGDLMRESSSEGLNELGSFGMTPEGARAKKQQLMADKDWRAKAMNPQSKEWAELQRIDGILAASVPQQ